MRDRRRMSAVVTTMMAARSNMSQVLLTAFSNRLDAVQLAHEAQAHLHSEGVSSALCLLDRDSEPDIDADTLVVSLGGDGTFLKSARLAHAFHARVLAV